MYDNCFSTGPFPLPCEQKQTPKTEIRFELQQSNMLKGPMAGIIHISQRASISSS